MTRKLFCRKSCIYITLLSCRRVSNQRIKKTKMPFQQESAGISSDLLDVCESAIRIEQYGSTRSLNVAAAAAIAMHWWTVTTGAHARGADESTAQE